jgi:hypothetical protein
MKFTLGLTSSINIEEPKQKSKELSMNNEIISRNKTDEKLFGFIVHPIANNLEEYDITTLKKSIKEHGLFQPVLLWWDKLTKKWYLVDGRHRVKAWNELYTNVDIQTHKLSKTTTEKDLPTVILEAQIIGRGLDVICANCEATLYLKDNKVKARDLAKKYDILNEKMLSALKTILEVRPLWFKALRNGDFVYVSDDGKSTKSTQKLASICVAERDNKPKIKKEDGDESVAIAFSKMKPHVTAILSLVGKDEKMLYAMNQLIKQGTKDFSLDYCITVPETQIQEQKNTINSNSKSIDVLMEHISFLEKELSSNNRCLEDFISKS